jgi:hypothetical protein
MERSDKREIKRTEQMKKPYKSPRLEIYGDLREITQAVGKTGKTDGNPGKGASKTQP